MNFLSWFQIMIKVGIYLQILPWVIEMKQKIDCSEGFVEMRGRYFGLFLSVYMVRPHLECRTYWFPLQMWNNHISYMVMGGRGGWTQWVSDTHLKEKTKIRSLCFSVVSSRQQYDEMESLWRIFYAKLSCFSFFFFLISL